MTLEQANACVTELITDGIFTSIRRSAEERARKVIEEQDRAELSRLLAEARGIARDGTDTAGAQDVLANMIEERK